jgi:hypothetical protein
MRRIHFVVLLFIAFLLTKTTQAQIFNAGISAGINISQIEGDGFAGYNKAGPAFGVFVNTFFSEKLAGQMEINYSVKGSQRQPALENPEYYRIDLRYIEIPLLARYFLPSGFVAEGGLSGGYLFKSGEKDEAGEIPVTHPFRKTEFAFVGGIAWLVSDKISFNPRFSYSLIPVRKHAGGGTYRLNRGQNNNVISFGLQYRF